MEVLHLIGNVTRDPETKTIDTANGPANLCKFTIAVNKRRKGTNNQQDAAFYNITAWRKLGEICQQYLKKGNKVYISSDSGVTANAFIGKDGTAKASLEVTASDIEFLGGKNNEQSGAVNAPADTAYTPVAGEELPF